MSNRVEYSHKLVIPPVEGIHQALAAFLQTSEQGSWSVDVLADSTPFVLRFRRGNWREQKGWLGRGASMSPQEGDPSTGGGVVVRTKPMLLEVTIRPSPEDHQIGLRHSVYHSQPCNNMADDGRRRDSWLPIILTEIADLREYLRKFYQLDAPPNFSSDPIDTRRAEVKAEQERKKAVEAEQRQKAEAEQRRRAEESARTTESFHRETDAELCADRTANQPRRDPTLNTKPLSQAGNHHPTDRLSLVLALLALLAVSAAVVGLIRIINEIRADVQLDDVAGARASSVRLAKWKQDS